MNFHTLLTRAPERPVFRNYDMATVLTNLTTIAQDAHFLKFIAHKCNKDSAAFYQLAFRISSVWIGALLSFRQHCKRHFLYF
jgi:hypothetical protein